MTLPDIHLPDSVVGLGFGSAITAGFAWLRSRSRNHAYTMGAVDHAVQTALASVTDRLEVVEGQHKECERSLGEVREDLRDAKQEIDRLMRGPVARPGQRAP